MEPIVEIKDVSAAYDGKQVLEHVNLTIMVEERPL